MDAREVTPSRWFRLILEDGDDLKGEFLAWARRANVKLAWLQCLGEAVGFRVASGYRGERPDSSTLMREVSANHHALAIGTIDRRGDREEVHLHGPLGRREDTRTGCWADRPVVFRGMEVLVVVLETEG